MLNVPVGQARHEAPGLGLNEPAGHAAHDDCPVPFPKKPAGHGRQLAEESAPSMELNVLLGHCRQKVLAVALLKNPLGHKRHADCPGNGL